MTFHSIAVTLALALAASASWAGDSHAGGHGHGSETSPIGAPGVAAKVTRTVTVDMTDGMRFSPSSISVKQGETIRFKVKNSGQLKHEFVLGTEQDLQEHYQLMIKNPEMEHEEPNMVTLAGGKTGELIWHFTQSGTVHFGCLQPGHWDAGMKGAVTVAKGQAQRAAAHHHH
ncbi:cupredoxin domain-containing protein [Caldimonas brevitalea]|uniref:Blue copper protein n=1 Tax=Caldimonas brevitalea TaxID=413882 RepID=A0A0G3BMM8_9BURK|nr:cupredoxin family protein [Caldimonas brevitalea]AKJ30709.1 blue copper protein [Caldimonas brevitalea]